MLHLNCDEPEINDISSQSGNHTQLISSKDDETNSKLDCEIKLYDDNFTPIKKYSTYIGLRLSGVKVVFLKRIISELVEYVRFHALLSIFGKSDDKVPIQPTKSTSFKNKKNIYN